MLYRKLTNWTNLAQTKGLLFFVQRLDELTFPYSLDSYKASTTGIITLVDEALELLNDPHIVSGNFGAVKHVLDELGLRLKGNFVAKKVFNFDIDSVLSGNLEGNITATIRKLKVFRSEMDPETYLGEITHLVISHDQEKPKKSQLEGTSIFEQFLVVWRRGRPEAGSWLSSGNWQSLAAAVLRPSSLVCHALTRDRFLDRPVFTPDTG